MASAWFPAGSAAACIPSSCFGLRSLATLAGTSPLAAGQLHPSPEAPAGGSSLLQRSNPTTAWRGQQPDGYGLHLWLETDTTTRGRVRTRWLPGCDAACFNGQTGSGIVSAPG